MIFSIVCCNSKLTNSFIIFSVEDSANLAARIGDSGGGEYVINYDKVWETLACATLDSIVLEKFGTRALRIFRFDCRKKPFLSFIIHDKMNV